jgi:hypothetical protein
MAQDFSFDYGQDVKFLDYEVYLRLHDDELRPLIPVGQCTADSINNTYEGETQVRLNRSGDIDVNSMGTMSFNIAHLKVDNINELQSHDKKTFDVCLESIGTAEGASTKRYMIVRDVIMNYQQNFGGGDVETLPVVFTKKVNSPVDWDTVTNTKPTDHVDYTATNLEVGDTTLDTGTTYDIDLTWDLSEDIKETDTQEIWVREYSSGSWKDWAVETNSIAPTAVTSTLNYDFNTIDEIEIAVRVNTGSLLRYSNIVTVETPIT